MVIGTHGDKITDDEKEEIKDQLERNYPCHDEVKDTLILDTMKRDDEEDPAIKKMIELVKLFVSDALCISTPAHIHQGGGARCPCCSHSCSIAPGVQYKVCPSRVLCSIGHCSVQQE